MKDYSTLAEFIKDLKIHGFGEKRAKNLANKVKNIQTLRYHIELGTIDQILLDTPDIGGVTKNEAIKKLKDIETLLLMEELEQQGCKLFEDETYYELEDIIDPSKLKVSKEDVKMQKGKFEIIEDDQIKGKNFVITGTLSMTRDYFVSLIIGEGGNVSNSVSSKTDYLIASNVDGEETTKWKKAKAIGTKIIDEDDFWKMYRKSKGPKAQY